MSYNTVKHTSSWNEFIVRRAKQSCMQSETNVMQTETRFGQHAERIYTYMIHTRTTALHIGL